MAAGLAAGGLPPGVGDPAAQTGLPAFGTSEPGRMTRRAAGGQPQSTSASWTCRTGWPKKNYHQLVQYIPDDEIDPEITEKFDAIPAVAESADPAGESE